MYSCKCIDLDKCICGSTYSPPVLDETLVLSFLVTPKLLNASDGRHTAEMKEPPGVLNRRHLFLLRVTEGAAVCSRRRQAGSRNTLRQVTRPTVCLTLSVCNEYLCIYSICAAQWLQGIVTHIHRGHYLLTYKVTYISDRDAKLHIRRGH